MSNAADAGARVAVIVHVGAFIVAVVWELILADPAVQVTRSALLEVAPPPAGGMVTLGIVSITGVVLLMLNAINVWRGSSWARWTLPAWWVLAIVSAFVVGPEVQSATTRAAILVYAGAGGAMLYIAFNPVGNRALGDPTPSSDL